MVISMEDPDVVLDLHELNSGNKTKYVFWAKCAEFLQEDVGEAVDDRRHQQVTHIAKAISVRDLVEQVASRCPQGTPIPSDSWVRLQFWPNNKHY